MKVHLGPYNDNGDREVEVEIHDYDTWSVDSTLALIIEPMLRQLKATTHGGPVVEAQDLPKDFIFEDSYDNIFSRWDWVLDEMIFTFESINDGDHYMASDQLYARLQNGIRLFTKYYFNLWD